MIHHWLLESLYSIFSVRVLISSSRGLDLFFKFRHDHLWVLCSLQKITFCKRHWFRFPFYNQRLFFKSFLMIFYNLTTSPYFVLWFSCFHFVIFCSHFFSVSVFWHIVSFLNLNGIILRLSSDLFLDNFKLVIPRGQTVRIFPYNWPANLFGCKCPLYDDFINIILQPQCRKNLSKSSMKNLTIISIF